MLYIPTKKSLEDLYLVKHQTTYSIALKTHRSRHFISNLLSQYGIPKRTPLEYLARGSSHYKWKGGRVMIASYPHIRVFPDDPFYSDIAKNSWGYVREHRYIMCQHLGRRLESHEIVHHLNGIRTDNRLCNLVIVNRHNHQHHTLQKHLQKRIRELEAELSQRHF